MKKISTIKKFLIYIVLFAFVNTSCKKLLEQAPEDKPYDDIYWKSESDAAKALAGDYSLLRSSLTRSEFSMSHFAYADLPVDEFSDFSDYALNFLVRGDEYYSTGVTIADFLGDYLGDLQDWSPFYKTIVTSNTILAKVPAIPLTEFKQDPTEKNKILGEAMFIRAYNYFYMVRIWGDVPLVLQYEPEPGKVKPIAKTNELVVLDSCIADLKAALPLLQWGYLNDGEKAVRANRGSAFALLADIYMWRDFLQASNDDLQSSISAVDSITTNGQYRLLDTTEFTQLYKGKSDEGIFEMNISASQNENQIYDGFFYVTTMDPFIKNKTSKNGIINDIRVNADHSNSSNLYDEDNDKRFEYNFFFTADGPMLSKYANGNVIYKNPSNFSQPSIDCNISLYRLAGMLLLRAEANAKLGRYADAAIDLNAVKSRAGIEDYSGADEDMYEEIIEERARELFCEGDRWYSLVRSRLLVDYIDNYTNGNFPQTRFDQQGWKWPISRTLFVNNNLLLQNTYWQGKIR